jgi:hypothetical protein
VTDQYEALFRRMSGKMPETVSEKGAGESERPDSNTR